MNIVTRLALPLLLCSAASAATTPFVVAPALRDKAELLPPSAVKLDGFIGSRCLANATNRMLTIDEESMLAGYRQKPGSHPWIGEHAGKWLHAATLAWANTGDPALRAKLDRFAGELMKAQEPDGYMGTYVSGKRFGLFKGADWDVWSHKYCMIGLLTYYQHTGNTNALACCRRACDLLINTFGPGKKSILSAGTHVGMAATSVLEPVVLLHRLTGEQRYLDFAKYIVKSWDEPNGPKVLATLLAEKSVRKTANAKAYEMMSNLVGLCELARVTGDADYVRACIVAWDDITARRLYITGTQSSREHFQDDFVLPNDVESHIGETCVTVTWIQLCAELFQLTGEAKYANEIERSIYNHLTAAQQPAGADWCYYTPLIGRKPYDKGITCCHSSGPRGLALAPSLAFARIDFGGAPGIVIGTFESAKATANIGGSDCSFELRSEFPRKGAAELSINAAAGASGFAIAFREPAWAAPVKFEIEGKPVETLRTNGWVVIPARKWADGAKIAIRFSLGPVAIPGDHGNEGLVAMQWGPLILAYDQAANPGGPAISKFKLAATKEGPPFAMKSDGALEFETRIVRAGSPETITATLVPFANAGATGSPFRVWLPGPATDFTTTGSLLEGGRETRSRNGNLNGSINDGDASTRVCTFDGTKTSEDWYSVALDSPAKISRIVFAHGHSFHDGGWFVANVRKPQVQIQREANGTWETVGELSGYPATTDTDGKNLKDGQVFTVKLASPVLAVALRVIGSPACGDDPRQAFSSCGELQAFEN